MKKYLFKFVAFLMVFALAFNVIPADGFALRASVLAYEPGTPVTGPPGVIVTGPTVLDLTNAERQRHGLLPLQWCNVLAEAARLHSVDMAINMRDHISHTSSNGTTFESRFMAAAGNLYTTGAENVAAGMRTSAEVVAGWMNSPGHRANILDPNMTHMGSGLHIIEDYLEFYWTQKFGGVAAAANETVITIPPCQQFNILDPGQSGTLSLMIFTNLPTGTYNITGWQHIGARIGRAAVEARGLTYGWPSAIRWTASSFTVPAPTLTTGESIVQNLTISYTIPANIPPGRYALEFTVNDRRGNSVRSTELIITISGAEEEDDYEPDFKIVAEETFEGRKYQLIDAGVTWDAARAHARLMGGDLAIIRDAAGQTFIQNLIAKGEKDIYWLGGSRSGENFRWVNNENISYTNWNQPPTTVASGNAIFIARTTSILFNTRQHRWSHISRNPSADEDSALELSNIGFIIEFPAEEEEEEEEEEENETVAVEILGEPAEWRDDPIPTENGVLLDFRASPENENGYRVFRAISETDDGVSISDSPITRRNDSNRIITFDPNVRQDEVYFYYVREVLEPALPDKPEVLGPPSARKRVEIPITESGNDKFDEGLSRGFIMMWIEDPTMNVNNAWQQIEPGGAISPVIRQGRTMLPIRAVVEAMTNSAPNSVGWYAPERRVDLAAQGNNVSMWIDRTDAQVNGSPAHMDIAPSIEGGRTLLPVRFVAEFLGTNIEWIASERLVIIIYNLPF
jgi:hypothetical protein